MQTLTTGGEEQINACPLPRANRTYLHAAPVVVNFAPDPLGRCDLQHTLFSQKCDSLAAQQFRTASCILTSWSRPDERKILRMVSPPYRRGFLKLAKAYTGRCAMAGIIMWEQT